MSQVDYTLTFNTDIFSVVILPSQECSLQNLTSREWPMQFFPNWLPGGTPSQTRSRRCWPPPQIRSHCVQLDHLDHSPAISRPAWSLKCSHWSVCYIISNFEILVFHIIVRQEIFHHMCIWDLALVFRMKVYAHLLIKNGRVICSLPKVEIKI